VNPRRGLLLGIVLIVAMSVGAVRATAAPLYDVKATWAPTKLVPGQEGQFIVQARNIGSENSGAELTITDELPNGVKATGVAIPVGPFTDLSSSVCTVSLGEDEVNCVFPPGFLEAFELGLAPGTKGHPLSGLYPSGYFPAIYIDVEVDPGASGTGTNTATIEGGGSAGAVSDEDEVEFGNEPAGFGLVPNSFVADGFDAAYPFGTSVRQAGAHPFEQRFKFDFNAKSILGTDGTRQTLEEGSVKTVEVTLPRGFIGNPEALPKCDPVLFAEAGPSADSSACPADTQVGYLNIAAAVGDRNHGEANFIIANSVLAHVPLYNLVPPKGKPADLAFKAAEFVSAHIYPELDPVQEYAIKTVTPNISSLVSTRSGDVTVWGVPGDPVHDKFRYFSELQENLDVAGAPFEGAIRPFLANPMDCGFLNGGASIRLESYQNQGQFTEPEEYASPDDVTGCGDPRFRFEPDIALQPTDNHAGAPTGLDVHLEVPQRNDEVSKAEDLYAQNGKVKAIPTPPIKRAIVTFPEGMALNPSAAQGLESCTEKEIGLETADPVKCPDGSQFGTLTLHTPILPESNPPKGFIYIAKQNENAFHNFLSLYLAIEEPERGILVKIPGKVDLDPSTGRITTTFDELPQFPVSDMQMSFKSGIRAGLVEPSTCGKKTITAEFFSWQDPTTPHPVESSFEITQKPDGSPCDKSLAERQFKPQLDTGTINNVAGSYSPFVFRLTRGDDDQEFSQLGVTLPPGLAAKFAGVTMCSDAAIASAEHRTGPGDGLLEQLGPSCPASSLIGTTQVGTGVGVPLTFVPGNVYLAGPYKGAPLSMVVITPAVVGPFDLGVIAVRSALNVNPETAQGSALTDPFPQIFQGIPVRIRDIRLKLDRPDFTLNPTSCDEKEIAAHVTGTGGNVSTTADDTAADLKNRFQAADCGSLGFGPKLSFRLFGGTHRGSHPKLQAVLRMPEGGANIARAAVALPHSEFLEQSHIRTVCTRVQFAAKECPAASVYGHAVAQTPLFDQPLGGPVYLRSSSNKLPDLVAVLRGPDSQPVEVALDGRIDSVNGGIRNTFELVPDAPVSKFTLTMQGGRKGLLVNSTNLCAQVSRATAKFTAQNGKVDVLHPQMRNSCSKAHKRRHARR
jgi:hypothetical protein